MVHCLSCISTVTAVAGQYVGSRNATESRVSLGRLVGFVSRFHPVFDLKITRVACIAVFILFAVIGNGGGLRHLN